jgi:hypothetical protein
MRANGDAYKNLMFAIRLRRSRMPLLLVCQMSP